MKEDFGMISGVVVSTGVAAVLIVGIFIGGVFDPNVRINGGSRLSGYLERQWGFQLSKK
jgi:hypothetical protein